MISKHTNLKDAGHLPLLIMIIMLLHIQHAEAQNIGIGITAPQTRLDILGTNAWDLQNTEGDVRIGNNTYRLKIGVALGGGGAGAVGIMQYGNPTGYNALSLGSQGNYLLNLYGASKIVEIANIAGGKVGIGTNNPNAALGFSSALGKKITLYPGASGDVGFAVQNNLLQIYADNPNADIAFGYDQAGIMTERFRVKANGALSVNGNTGNSGEILQSNGSGAAPVWVTNLYNNTYFGSQSGLLTLNPCNGCSNWADVPNATVTFTLTRNAKVILSAYVNPIGAGCFACGSSQVGLSIFENGSGVINTQGMVNNGKETSIAIPNEVRSLGPGTYTFKILGSLNESGGQSVSFYGGYITAIIAYQ